MYTVDVSKDAKEDMYAIYRYIAYDLLVPDTAIKLIERLEKAILSLDSLPERHQVYDNSKWQHLRMMPVDNYCIFYTINDETTTVNIARVLYGKRNFDAIFK